MKTWLPIVLILAALGTVVALFNAPPSSQYCWLVFGPHRARRVLVERSGKALAVDLDGDGRFSTAERFPTLDACQQVAIVDTAGSMRYVITSVGQYQNKDMAAPRLMFNVDIEGPVAYQQYCDVGTKPAKQGAPEAHFHGPLAVDVPRIWGKFPEGLVLTRGEEPSELRVTIGTFDVAKDCWVVVRTHDDDGKLGFPPGVHPFAEVTFPSRTPGEPPILKRYPLDQFC
jgi:hypothetical protein